MPYKLSDKQLDSIKVQLELEIPFREIAKIILCSYSKIMEVRTNICVFGILWPPKLSTPGPNKLITQGIEQVKSEFLWRQIY